MVNNRTDHPPEVGQLAGIDIVTTTFTIATTAQKSVYLLLAPPPTISAFDTRTNRPPISAIATATARPPPTNHRHTR
ncbi:hypothetical protein PsorP6_005857 [Peronosclerospora sorghi]|uniref:Uncharacterized protein n=1 Tax=Peronosclerospora sorghi TaxID=230839 RepID=A0ACC0W4C5_9STRA|nr:hypothetical protein PsorP6_005857 [Peronosclerospora sorghi]